MDVCKSNGTHTSFSTDLLITHGGTAPPFYSYTTCRGDASAWKDTLVADGLKGKTLNVAFPVDNVPEHFMVHKGTEERICTNDEGCQVLEDPELYDMRGLWIEYVQERSERANQAAWRQHKLSLSRPSSNARAQVLGSDRRAGRVHVLVRACEPGQHHQAREPLDWYVQP
jgi:hypothetical protein